MILFLMNFKKTLTALILLVSTTSCIFLSKSQVAKKNDQEAISIVAVKILYNGKVETKNHGMLGFCQLRFKDENDDSVKFRNDEHYEFYMLKSASGRVMLESMRCMHHIIPLIYLKYREVDFTDFAFQARGGFINYVGHITINYRPKGFRLIDLLGLGGLKADETGKIEVKVEDRIDGVITFLNLYYPELRALPLTKSILTDPTNLKPNIKPEAYQPAPVFSPPMNNNIAPMPAPIPNAPAQAPNYAPYYSQYPGLSLTPYYDPYKNQAPRPYAEPLPDTY